MKLRILYVEEPGERDWIAGCEVARVQLLGEGYWEDQRRTGWPPASQLWAFAARIAARDWHPNEWECISMCPIDQMGPRTMAMLWGVCGHRLDDANVVVRMRRRPHGPRREDGSDG